MSLVGQTMKHQHFKSRHLGSLQLKCLRRGEMRFLQENLHMKQDLEIF